MGCNRSSADLPAPKPIQPAPEVPQRGPRSPRMSVAVETLKRQLSFKRSNSKLTTSSLTSIKDHFKILKAIATDISGTVLLAQDLRTGVYRLVREISKQVWKENRKFFREVDMLKEFDHPNIVKVYYLFESAMNYYSIFEYLDGGNIREKTKSSRSETFLSKSVRDITGALNYLHLQGFAHCNLTPENILFLDSNEDSVPKLIGFEFAQNIDRVHLEELKDIDRSYAAPEVLKGTLSDKSDIWSLGVIVFELLTGRHPYKGKEAKLADVLSNTLSQENHSFTELSFNAQEFIKGALKINPEDRMSAKEVLDHPWIALSSKELVINYEAMLRLRSFKAKTNITREILRHIVTMINLQDHEIIKVFQSLDGDADGFVCEEEIVEGFRIVGIDATNEIDTIMENIDIDESGALDFSEIKIALADWKKILKKKLLSNVFKDDAGVVELETFKHLFLEILPHEWNEFFRKTKGESGKVEIVKLKNYLKENIE